MKFQFEYENSIFIAEIILMKTLEIPLEKTEIFIKNSSTIFYVTLNA